MNIVHGIVDIGSMEEYNEVRGIYVGICPFVYNDIGGKRLWVIKNQIVFIVPAANGIVR